MTRGELAVDDFSFRGRLGSQGTTIERAGRNHFRVKLGCAPGHPEWCNLLQFEIVRNARHNDLRLDVAFDGDRKFRFNHDASTWSYDSRTWMPVAWKHGNVPGGEKEDTLLFPEFAGDTVYVGAQVPISYEEVVEFMDAYGRHPHAVVHTIGHSLGGRGIYRLEIADPTSRVPPGERWGFHVNQQHSGEHHGQWRMIGMIDWLLSEAGAAFRKRSVWHFVLEMNPDGPTNGWYRVNGQGVDLNRAYLVTGADPARQPHESYVLQRDLEALMASPTPITACWSMHTFPGDAAPFMNPGPEVGTRLGPATELASLLDRLDTRHLIRPMVVNDPGPTATLCWHDGPHVQFGITGFTCEGSDFWTDKNLSTEVGQVLIQTMESYYR